MEESTQQIFDYLLAAIIFMFAIGFTVTIFAMGTRYNKMLTDDINRKASSRQQMPYATAFVYITPAEVFTDILSEEECGIIKLNGVALNLDTIEKAQLGDSAATSMIRNALTFSKYHKVLGYDSNGQITQIDFIGE